MSGTYRVRQATLGDWPAIARFVAQSFDVYAPFKHERRWRWQQQVSPNVGSDALVSTWIALHNEEVVGQIIGQPAEVFVGGMRQRVFWLVDLMVLPEHRGARLARRIHDLLLQDGDVFMTLTMAPAKRRLDETLGAVTLPPITEFLRVQGMSMATTRYMITQQTGRSARLASVGRLVERWSILPATAAAIISVGGTAARLAARSRRPKLDSEIVDVDDFDAALLEEIDSARQQVAGGASSRRADFCRWRFLQAPDLRYRIAELPGRGYAVWREAIAGEVVIATLADVICRPDDREAYARLASHATAAMAKADAISASGALTPDVAALRQLGYVPVRSHAPTVITLNEEAKARFRDVQDKEWLLGKADQDWDQVRPIA